jgi:hypothetical protein
MNDTIPLRMRRLAAEEVLASLVDVYAFNANVNDSTPYCTGDVHADMTVKDFCDDMELSDVRLFLNFWFNLTLTRDEVRAAATPARKRTLRELCQFLATRIEAPAIEPVTVLGRPCLSAGVFLIVRTILAQAGADVSQLAPSSSLGSYLRDHFMIFARDISKLSPGTFPRIEEAERPTISLKWVGIVSAVIVGFVALAWSVDREVLNCCSSVLAALLATFSFVYWVRHKCVPSADPELPGVHDFRDLVDKLLGRPLRRPIAPNLSASP